MVKILNVMDEIGNVNDLGDGLYESGFWHAPDRDCQIIRVFGADKGASRMGGEIMSVRTDEKTGKKIFLFKDTPEQHGKRRPMQFRPNGCYAENE